MKMDYKSLSLANQVYDIIEEKILNGVYPQGEILSESRLSDELGVSRTPVREAMTRLENENLIASSPSGTVVLGITDRDVDDMFLVKSVLEPVVGRLAAANRTAKQLEQMRDILEQQEFYTGKSNTERVKNLDTGFHDIMYTASGSPTFQAILSSVHHKLMKYRKDSLNIENRSQRVMSEHTAIYEAIKAQDEDLVEKLVKEHLQNAYDNIKKGTK
ncbi:MAG: GntR family transcriptional regulator [Anaerovoracaceae bacterium]|mgnify:CR=1 FL=1|nr:GntR family transcriptional regulator [Anaerovoracaceae bacterium]